MHPQERIPAAHVLLGLVSALIVVMAAGTPAQCAEPEVSVSLSASRQEAKPCDPVEFRITIHNLSDRELSVLRPDVIHYSVVPKFEDSATGKPVGQQLLWSSWWVTDEVKIPAGKTYEYAFQIEQFFPLCLSPGSYEVWCEYTPDRMTRLQTDRIALKVQPLSDDEADEWQAVLGLIRRGESLDGICGSADFLRQHPTSRFRNMVRLSLGEKLLQMKLYWDAEKTLRAVLEDPECSAYHRDHANWYMALTLKAFGSVAEAVKFLEKIGTPDAMQEAAMWQADAAADPGD
jgi:hypothetical protein